MPPQPERRFLTATPAVTGRTIFGYAARFNSRSENLGTTDQPIFEIIKPGAFDSVLKDDVRALFNHDSNLILARSKNGKGTLKLSIDTIGLRYEFEAPETQVGNDLLVSIKRGDIDQSSFSFSIAPGGDSWSNEGRNRIRTIMKIKTLHDVSPVTSPGYLETSVSARKSSPKPIVPMAELDPSFLALRLGLKSKR